MKQPSGAVLFVASVVSRLFDPFILFPILLVLSLVRSGMAGWEIVRVMSLVSAGMILPPALLLLWAVKTGKVSNWDMSKRTERVRALSVFSAFLLIDWIVIGLTGIPQLVQLFGVLGIIFIGFFLITLKFKLSGHMTTLMLFLVACSVWYGPIMWPAYAFVPLVAWSRLILKRHTFPQIVVGTLYGVGVSLLCAAFGLIS